MYFVKRQYLPGRSVAQKSQRLGRMIRYFIKHTAHPLQQGDGIVFEHGSIGARHMQLQHNATR